MENKLKIKDQNLKKKNRKRNKRRKLEKQNYCNL